MRKGIAILCLMGGLPTAVWGQGRTGGETQALEAVRKADQAFSEKRMQDAIRLYLQALGQDRNLTAAYVKVAIAYYATRQYRPAVARLRICVQVAPTFAPCFQWLGMHLLKLRQRQAGIQALEAAIRKDWKLPLAMRLLGRHYYKAGNYPKAERALWTFLKFRDKDWPARVDYPIRVLLGRSYLKMHRYPAAQAQFVKAIKIRGRGLAAKLGLADAYLGRGYYSDSLNLYLALKRIWPKRPRIHLDIAKCFYRLHRRDKALEHLRRYRAVRPRDPAAIILLGDIHFFFKELGPALAAYKQATQLAPNDPDPQVRYAAALVKAKRGAKAIRILTAARRRWPKLPGLLLALAEAQLLQKKPSEAITTLDSLLKVAPRSFQGLLLRARAHQAAKQVDKAVADYRLALIVTPGSGKARLGLIRALNAAAFHGLRAGRTDRALSLLSEAFRLAPKGLYTNLNLGVVYLMAKRYKEALRHLTEVHKRLPRNFAANRLLGRLYYETGRLKAARGHYLQARNLSRRLASSAQAEVEIDLGALLAAQGEIDSAVDVLGSAVSNAAGNKRLASVAQRNLAIALMDRGYRRLEAGKGPEALADLEKAHGYAKLLAGDQPVLLRFLLAMAYLEAGKWAQAGKAFRKLTGRKMLAKVLNPPFDRLGVRYFQAYTRYRQGAYEAAATQMTRLMRGAPAKIKGRLRDIVRSAYEIRASQLVRRGRYRKAQKLFRTAKTYGLSGAGALNQAVALYRGGKRAAALRIWQRGGLPATALCNLGTHYDNSGNPKQAYTYYVRCKKRGGAGRDIQRRIQTLKRIFGF